MVKVLTWNVNSIRKRVLQLCDVLTKYDVDVAMLQETKCTNDQFPTSPLEDIGYSCYVHGQKARNGVAIISRIPVLEETHDLFEGDCNSLGSAGSYSAKEARYMECSVEFNNTKLKLASVYVPNGQEVGTETFDYKLNFLEHLKQRLLRLVNTEDLVIVGGDYNVAPDTIDVYDPEALEGKLCFHKKERAKFRELLHCGFFDAFRIFAPESQEFSWWNYKEGAWQRNRGMRIDHLLLSPQVADMFIACTILREIRGFDSPSDHAPVLCSIKT